MGRLGIPEEFLPCLSEDGSEITLSGKLLVSVPGWLKQLTSLTYLDLSNNQLTELPGWLGHLPSLTYLNLGNNQLGELPASLGQLTGLTELHLDSNPLSELPASLGQLARLTRLHLYGQQLTTLPGWLARLASLTFIDLGSNQLSELPRWLGDLTSLTVLYLDSNPLSELPASLGDLTRLAVLHLGNSQLTHLPASLGNLAALTELHLSRNRLTQLPDSLGNLAQLTELHLDSNRLIQLPDSLGNLTRLTELHLDDNRLTHLPESLASLTRLTELHLEDNQLTNLPDGLGALQTLEILALDRNPLRSPLLELAEDGTAAIKAYLSSVMHHPTELWKSKLLVVGEGNAGKTSLVRALTGEEHNPQEPTTHGIRIVDIELANPAAPDGKMWLSSWDFGGQDIYHATHQFFLSDRSLFLLLWNTRQGWEHAKIPYWLDIIKARAPHARIILVATHTSDRPADLPLTDLRTSFPQILASVSVDNSTNEGIGELRLLMAELAADLPLMGSRWPKAWITGLDVISKSDRQYATPDELYRKLASVGVTSRSHQAYLLRALHLLGDILYFDDDEELRDTIILHPQWVTSYIAKILDSREVARNHGLLTRSHKQELWADLDIGLSDRFLLMMEKFDLSYRIPDDPAAASLVVERLPWESPRYQERWDSALDVPGTREIRLVYRLDTLPPGVPTWFIAREHRFTTHLQWRSGALLQHTGDHRVLGLIKADRQNKAIDLAVRGPVPQLFFSILQDGLESTLSRYQGLRINRLVPCLCNLGDGAQPGLPCPHLYQYGALIRRLERRIPDIECEVSGARVNVADLLFAIAPASSEEIVGRLADLSSRLADIGANVNAVQSAIAFSHREFLKVLRQQQARLEAVCPSIFTLTAATGRFYLPGLKRLQLRLYCEQPGAFHALPGEPYIITKPAPWLQATGPYLVTLVRVLKHAAPLAGPILDISAEQLARTLKGEIELMNELIRQLPDEIGDAEAGLPVAPNLSRAEHDVDYRALHALLRGLDPNEHWGGLSRTYTPEGEVLWLCRDHARQYARPGGA